MGAFPTVSGLRRAHWNRRTRGQLFPTLYTVINQNNRRVAWMQSAWSHAVPFIFFKVTLLVPTFPSLPWTQKESALFGGLCTSPGCALACK